MRENTASETIAEQSLWKVRLLRRAIITVLAGSLIMISMWIIRMGRIDGAAAFAILLTLPNAVVLHPGFGWRAKGVLLVTQLTLVGLYFPLHLGVRYTALSIAGAAVMITATFFGRRVALVLLAFDAIVISSYGFLSQLGYLAIDVQPLPGDTVLSTWLKVVVVFVAVGAMLVMLISGIVDSLQVSIRRLRRVSEIAATDRRYIRQLIDSAPEAIVVFDMRQGRFIDVNPQAEKLFGHSAARLKEMTPADLSPPLQENGRPSAELAREYLSRAADGEMPVFEWLHTNSSGESIPCEIRLHRMPVEGAVQIRGSITDIRERRKSQAIIHSLALYDNLTGLPNRKLFQDRLRHTIAASERDQQYSALFFIDVDNFKNINDTSGHASGDFYLTVVAERLSTCVNEGDTVARWGGDEFVVIAENLTGSLSEAARRAELMGEKMIAALAEPCENPYARGQYFQNTVSVGLTLLYGHIHSPEELLKRADIAMYQAKMSGKNRLRNFDVRMQREIEQKLAFENDLRRAVAAGEFQLYYQPQVDAARVIFGAEVLLRWFHPTRGQVLPGDFIALAEETGDILPIGRWVIEAACKKLAQWQRDERTKHLVLSLNVSPRQFRDPQFVDYVTQAVRDTGINPRGLKLELTEGLMLDNIEETIGKMEALGKTGLSFCLDDFGTGYSSLSYLKRLPLSQIKIDQSFVRDIEVDANDAVLIRTIIGMANNLNLGVIAEGVETEEQWQMLRAMGCSAYQGFYFGRPAPAAELEALAAKP